MFRREGTIKLRKVYRATDLIFTAELPFAVILRKLFSVEFSEYLFLHPFAEVAQLVRAQDS